MRNRYIPTTGAIFLLACSEPIIEPIEAFCGDSVIKDNEVCDDGNRDGGDGCRSDCLGLEVCGDGLLDVGEVCDAGSDCNDDCQKIAFCGDLFLDDDEQCDDGNQDAADGCAANCTLEICGNGTVEGNEACDDGNTVSGDGCRADCLGVEVCGDGLVELGEECDDGNEIDADGCEADCTLPACQNGIRDPGEVCYVSSSLTDNNSGLFDPRAELIDLDGDQAPELIVGNSSNGMRLFRNNGVGQMIQQATLSGCGITVDAEDFDGDGRVDILCLSGSTPRILRNQSTPGAPLLVVEAPLAINSFEPKVVDFDTDGDPDIVARVSISNTLALFLNEAGVFATPPIDLVTVSLTNEFTLMDVNQDNAPDLVVSSGIGPEAQIDVFINDGQGALFVQQTIELGDSSETLEVIDANGDGLEDLVAFDFSSVAFFTVYLSNGTTLADPGPSYASSAAFLPAFFDFDADGDLDIGGRRDDRFAIIFNDGSGQFLESGEFFPLQSSAIEATDLNSDGIIDLVAIDSFLVTIFLSAP